LAHSFAKLVYVVCVGVRCEMCIPESMATLIRDLPEAAPTVMPSVPRVFEKLYTKILAGVDTAGPVRKQAFAAALAVGRKVSALRQRGEEPTGLLKVQHQLAERLVFSRIHTLLGGRIRAFISGGAPLSKELAEFFHACGLTILEGYGMTENCAAATVNRLDDFRLGTVGKPIPGVEVAIAADCEVLIRGGNIMTSYWRNPEATAAALDRDGWLHTGDIGEVDADGFLRITDRKKDLIITAGGKNVAPQNLEAHLKTSRYISNCLVYGDRRKFLTALITLDEDAVAVWARERGLQWSSHAELSQHAEVFRLLQAVVDDKNRALASYETVKKFAILERDFDVEAGELTPSLKLRRREIVTRHLGLLDSFYTEHY
jgi:long-chain acyl-CoA synthetase